MLGTGVAVTMSRRVTKCWERGKRIVQGECPEAHVLVSVSFPPVCFEVHQLLV